MTKKLKSKTKKRSTYWDQLIAKQKPRKARPKHKATRKPQPKKAKTMAKKAKAQTAEAPDQHHPDDEFLPPPDPPFEESLPRPPATGYEVSHEQKGAHPEDPNAQRELQIAPESTPGAEGPKPEEPAPEEPPPPPEGEV